MDNYHYFEHVTDKFWYTKKTYHNEWLHYDRKRHEFNDFDNEQNFISFVEDLHEKEKKELIAKIISKLVISRKDKMHLLDLAKNINDTFRRTIKFNSDGSFAHKVDRDVMHVISIAVASDLLEMYDLKKKDNT